MKNLRFLITALLLSCCLAGVAQTKLISFKSHSGSKLHFRKAIENNMFDLNQSNFGLVVSYTTKIDTVAKINGRLILYKAIEQNANGKLKITYKKDSLSIEESKKMLKLKTDSELKKALLKKYKGLVIDSLTVIDLNKKIK